MTVRDQRDTTMLGTKAVCVLVCPGRSFYSDVCVLLPLFRPGSGLDFLSKAFIHLH